MLRMKIIKIMVLIAVVLFSVPVHATEGHFDNACPMDHCVLVCHTGCHTAIPPSFEVPLILLATDTTLISSHSFFYEDPAILGYKRPPIVSA